VVAGASLASAPASAATKPGKPELPNIVLVLTDDLSWNLVPYMAEVRKMQRQGMTFTNYFVTNSLCCPSRASILTGLYPHNHGVFTNTAPFGGFVAFRDGGGESATFATELQWAGYRTAMLGKYFNGYHSRSRYVPPGWSNWQVPGSAYRGFKYVMNANGRTARFGSRRRAYITDVMRRRGKGFVSRVARKDSPFLLELSTFAPHHPFTPAPRHRFEFPFAIAPRSGAFNVGTTNAPEWLRGLDPLNEAEIGILDENFRKRAQAVQAVDDMIGEIRDELREAGVNRNTYVVFTSDNGFHMGEHRLTGGKMTPYDHDIRVPLIVVGPGIEPGSTSDELTQNTDIAPTFMRLAGVNPPDLDGRSLVPLLQGGGFDTPRDAVLIEFQRPPTPNGDPDRQAIEAGHPPSYMALRTREELYVEYVTGEREWYDIQRDPDQLDNAYDRLDPTRRARLEQRLAELSRCSGAGCKR
jgi:arylsulfatase A-like enzyme